MKHLTLSANGFWIKLKNGKLSFDADAHLFVQGTFVAIKKPRRSLLNTLPDFTDIKVRFRGLTFTFRRFMWDRIKIDGREHQFELGGCYCNLKRVRDHFWVTNVEF